MAEHIGYSVDFLRKNKGSIFFEGIHYCRPLGSKRDSWIVEEMEKWALGERRVSDTAKKVLENIL